MSNEGQLPLAQCLDSVRTRIFEHDTQVYAFDAQRGPEELEHVLSANRDLLPSPVSNKAQTMPRYAHSFEEPRGGYSGGPWESSEAVTWEVHD
ncbi:hypothetical protein QLX08_010466 [Tetragonisca angustula]|uniref:Uncharacterized protein n=1 Tax=Tetragonisca angustula TaxID=166442 RepID=A0AAW0ZC47_9HYME